MGKINPSRRKACLVFSCLASPSDAGVVRSYLETTCHSYLCVVPQIREKLCPPRGVEMEHCSLSSRLNSNGNLGL